MVRPSMQNILNPDIHPVVMEGLSEIASDIETQLNEKEEVREVALKSSRNIVRLCGMAVRSMHLGNDPAENMAVAMDELQKLKDEIEKLKSQPGVSPAEARRMDVAQTDIQDAKDEAAKDKPVAGRIKTTLDGAKETMEKLGGSIGAAMNLGTTIGNLALMVFKLF